MKLWIARDKNGYLNGYDEEPLRNEKSGFFFTKNVFNKQYDLDSRFFPEVTWENSPKQVKIELL